MAQPVIREVLKDLAEHGGVCTRPLAIKRIDRLTGQTVDVLEVPCGARIASKCKPCAERNRRLRQIQIREGWHLTEEPVVQVEQPTAEVVAMLQLRGTFLALRDNCVRADDWDQVRDLDQGIAEVDEMLAGSRIRGTLPKPGAQRKPRTVRSTRRRQSAPALPRRRVESRTVGRIDHSKTGKQHRPSMLLTTTLPSYGAVHTGKRMRRGQLEPCACGCLHGEQDGQLGTPSDPDTYDYRDQALGLIFFPHVLDRFWQNYRRAVGWKVQYAGAVEMQRRLATHAHYAVRGTAPRALTKQVAAGTYHQVWWPRFDQLVYPIDRPPVWDEAEQSFVDPKTSEPLKTWDEATAEVANADGPAYVATLGTVDVRGIESGTEHAERAIRYATKYLTKDLADQTLVRSDAQKDHAERLRHELRVLPCSERCANWLLYGVQPDRARPDLTPGACRGKVHQRQSLGYTGRRCLVSRNWSGKTLTDHRLDGREWFRAVTAGLLDDNDEDQAATDKQPVEKHRYLYRIARPGDRDVDPVEERILRSIHNRQRARLLLRIARDGPQATDVPATTPPQAAGPSTPCRKSRTCSASRSAAPTR
jgi:hypothetical protein